MVESEKLPVFRGVSLSEDDILRREVINQLICHFELSFKYIENIFSIKFHEYFSDELDRIKDMQADSLLELTEDKILVRLEGKLLIRNICMVFDVYLQENKHQRFSKTI